ncbi:MAG: hypothetical protein AAF642_01355 [Pseudomonadota bacterium]
MMKTIVSTIALVGTLASFSPSQAHAQVNTSIVEVPTGWKIQNYVPNNVVIWYAPTNCVNGKLTLPANATDQDRDRLWALILSAKMAQAPVQIYYERYEDGRHCRITSFSAVQS